MSPGRPITCQRNAWKCLDKLKCLTISKVCDGIYDCQDHSDEKFCSNGSKAAYTPEIEVMTAGKLKKKFDGKAFLCLFF